MYNLDQTTAAFTSADESVERESMEYDVCLLYTSDAAETPYV